MDKKEIDLEKIEVPYVQANDGFLRFEQLPKEVRLRMVHEEKEGRAARAEYREKLE